jgi:maltose O-acetyltransferase
LIPNRFLNFIARIFEDSRWEYTYREYRKKYDIADSFRFSGVGTVLYGDGKIVLGENSYIGEHSSVQSSKGCVVRVGKNCSISHYVMVYTENLIADQDFDKSRRTVKGNVTIGDNCWIGARVFIREGVTIGENVVVGANSVVTKDIPSFCVAAGCPARVRRERTSIFMIPLKGAEHHPSETQLMALVKR